MSTLALFFRFGGRINRARYWIAMLVLAAIIELLSVSINYLGDDRSWFGYAIPALVFLLTVYSGFAVGAKRFHDRDKSGWPQLYLLASVLVLLPAEITQNQFLIVAGTFSSWAVSLWFLIELGFLPGTAGPNRFGQDPLERGAASFKGAL